jgi:TolB protein
MQNTRALLKVIPVLLLLAHLPSVSFAQAQTGYLKVGEAKVKKSVLALTVPQTDATHVANANLVAKTIQDDLDFVDFFRMLPPSAFAQNKIAKPEDVNYAEWVKTGADYVSFALFSSEGSRASLEFHLASAGGNKEVFAKRYSADASELKILAHTVANDIVQNVTGKPGIFLTKIAFQCDKSGKKEIFTSNFDGSDVRQVTKLRSIAMSPAWNSDGTKLAFSVYNRHSDNIKNIDLFELNFKTGSLKLLSNKKGINSGANYSPDGSRLAYTMSYTGNPEIHVLDFSSGESTQLTRSVGFDVDPAFSPDGRQLAFVSSRAGKPMLYVTDVRNPSNVKRLTYAGQFNATPSWSPDGKRITFAGWLDSHFDLFTISADGSKIERLTKNEGNNEDPSNSPDGNFVTFSSNRGAGKNIYLMNLDGGNVKRLTFGLGNCVQPKWSPFL